MRVFRSVSMVLTMGLATMASAADFDGSVALTCTVKQAHDCLPTESTCSRLKPESDIKPIFGINFAKKEIRSPYRTAILPVLHTATNDDSIVLQGADLRVAWSAMVDKSTGELTISIADSKGAYVAFGQCEVDTAK